MNLSLPGLFGLHEKCESVMNRVGPAPAGVAKTNFTIFSDTINVIDVKLCMMVHLLLIELYLLIPLSLTLTIFQGHNSIKQF